MISFDDILMMVMMISLFGGIFGTSDLRGYGGGGQFRVFRCVAGLLPSKETGRKDKQTRKKKKVPCGEIIFSFAWTKIVHGPRIKRSYELLCCCRPRALRVVLGIALPSWAP